MHKNFWGIFAIIVIWVILMVQDLFAGSALQISVVPGVSIWLDRQFLGKTTKEQNGMLIADLAPGDYELKATLPDYSPAETHIKIENNQNIEWRIKLVEPVMQVEDNVRRVDSTMIRLAPTGTVILKSLPLKAEIFFDGDGIGPADKKLTNVAAAEHTVKFVYEKHELVKNFTLQPSESLLLQADFTQEKVDAASARINNGRGPAVIKMQSLRRGKPAIFPHRAHQERFSCANCHHGMDEHGKQIPYREGMEINYCSSCHNPMMANKRLDSLMQAAHTLCKDCHRKIVKESGAAGPIEKCLGCHIVPEE